MILFEKDLYEQNVYVDVTTSNMSFIKMAKILKMLGIKNNKFFLALHDRDLIGVDPHNLNDPSIELRLRIGRETKQNVWYYLREVCRVNSAGGDGSTPYILNRYNLAITWCVFNNLDNYSTIIRQIGKTTALLAIKAYLMYIKESHYSLGFMSKDADAVQEAVKRIKIIRDYLPSYLVHKVYKDGDNKEGLTYEALKNEFKTFIAQKSEIQAKKQARGLSLPFLSKDEFGFQDNNHVMFPSAIASTTTAREQAIAKGSLGVLCVSTTAADPDTPAGGYAHKIKEDCMLFQDKFYDMANRDELLQLLDVGSKRKMFFITYNHRQLGKTDQWLEEVIIRAACSEDEADRDYRNIWKRGSTGGALDPATKKAISNSMIDPKHVEIVEGFVFNYYVTEAELNDVNFIRKPFIMGMDSSENIGQDFSTLFMLDPLTFMPVMSLRCNNSNLNKFAKVIFKLMLRFERTIWIPERNHVGAMIVDTVIDLLQSVNINPYMRIFNTLVNEAANIYDIDRSQVILGAAKAKFGFRTHGGATGRAMLYGTTFTEAMKRNKHQILDGTLVDQLRELIIKNGRVDHPKGKNDDMVIAYLLACYFTYFAKNITFYGIEHDEVMDFNIEIETDIDGNETVINKNEYLLLYRKMKELESKIDICSSPILKSEFECELRELQDYLKVFNISEDIVTRNQLETNINDQNYMTDEKRAYLTNRFTSLF